MTVPTLPAGIGPDQSLRIVRITAAVLCMFGGAVMIWSFFQFILVFPAPTGLTIVLELPRLVVGFLLLRVLRPVRNPPLLWSAAATVWGGSAAIGCALLANQGLLSLWAKIAGVGFASEWSDSLSAPLNEEVLKLCGVVMIVLAAPGLIRGPLDGMVFGALTGLGFQAVENVTYGLDSIVQSGATDPNRAVTHSFLVRLSIGVGSHWAMTAVAGAGIGYLVLHGRTRRGIVGAVACLAVAMGMHLLFDAPHPIVAIKVTVNFIIVAALYFWLNESYRARARAVLRRYALAGFITEDEAGGILSRVSRQRELRHADSDGHRDAVRARQDDVLETVEAEAA
jgi:RsiW-degrading membrane proteinase PrsW (M82 family)